MAFMRPEYDPEQIPHDSERRVFAALRDQLSNDYVVLHSYPWLRPDRDGVLREGEADFVVLHRDRGLLVLEVKGGELRYERGRWERKKARGYEPITDPFAQARKSMHTLVDRIEKHSDGDVGRNHFTYGYAVAFPHDNYEGPEPPGGDPVIIITRREMSSLKEAIETAMSRWPQKTDPMTQHRWGRLTTALLPEFRLYRPIADTAEQLHEKIREMTSEQLEVFRGIYDDNARVYVTGVAGSGKTQLALDRALDLARRELRTLLVCYNRHLAERLEATVQASPFDRQCLEFLKIRHFHGLARELIEDAGVDWRLPTGDTMQEQQFFISQVPDLMEQAALLLMDQSENVQFDAIVIDEAQDFHARWWEALQCTLLKEAEDGTLYAFADPAQRLWDWAPHKPPASFDARFRLRRNCRNSRWIARTSTQLAGIDADLFERSPIGGRPKIDVVSSPAAMNGTVLAAVKQLIKQHDLLASQIVLIGPRSWGNGSLSQVNDVNGVPLTDSIAEWYQGEGILVSTTRSFKGLESDVVVVYDLQRLSETFNIIDLYVACTRGRSHLHFLVTGQNLVTTIRGAIAHVQQELG